MHPERGGSACDDEPAQDTKRLLDVRRPDLGARDARRCDRSRVFLRESLGAFVFAACLLTLAVAFWLWILRRLTR